MRYFTIPRIGRESGAMGNFAVPRVGRESGAMRNLRTRHCGESISRHPNQDRQAYRQAN